MLFDVPCKIGDDAWVLRYYHNKKIPQKGTVSEIKFIPGLNGMELQIVVKHIGRGKWGENIFATKEEAEKALERRRNEGFTSLA